MGGLHTIAKLDTTVTLIDAFNLLSNFDTAEFLSDRYGSNQIIPEDERTISDLMVDQIEFADVLIINKIESVDEMTRERIRQLLNLLNPQAKVLEASFAKVDVKEIIGTGRFDFIKAASGAGWLRSLHEMTVINTGAGKRLAPKPETLEYVLFLSFCEGKGNCSNRMEDTASTTLSTLLDDHSTRVVSSPFSTTNSSSFKTAKKMKTTTTKKKNPKQTRQTKWKSTKHPQQPPTPQSKTSNNQTPPQSCPTNAPTRPLDQSSAPKVFTG